MQLWHYNKYICLDIAGMHTFTNKSASRPDIYRALRSYIKYTNYDIEKSQGTIHIENS